MKWFDGMLSAVISLLVAYVLWMIAHWNPDIGSWGTGSRIGMLIFAMAAWFIYNVKTE